MQEHPVYTRPDRFRHGSTSLTPFNLTGDIAHRKFGTPAATRIPPCSQIKPRPWHHRQSAATAAHRFVTRTGKLLELKPRLPVHSMRVKFPGENRPDRSLFAKENTGVTETGRLIAHQFDLLMRRRCSAAETTAFAVSPWKRLWQPKQFQQILPSDRGNVAV
jgi:hypothetical protein